MSFNNINEKINMIIDTDPGVDDILALLLAFRAQHVDVKSICLTHGNTNLNNVMRNFCSLFHTLTLQHNHSLAKDQNAKDLFSKPNLPRVAIGSTAPMKGDCFAAEDVHGSDGFGNLTNTHPHFIDNEFKSKLSKEVAFENKANDTGARFEVSEYNAVDEILFQLKNNPPFTITIVALGPLTNLAKAIQKDAYTVGLAKHIYIMGGACKVPGNVTTEAEFNFFADGYAAKVVLDATRNFDEAAHLERIKNSSVDTKFDVPLPLAISLVPLDITMSTYLLRKTIEDKVGLKQDIPLASFFKNLLNIAIEWSLEFEKVDGIALHDPLCMGIAMGLVKPKTEYETIDVEYEHEHLLGKCVIKTTLTESSDIKKDCSCVRVCYSFDEADGFQHSLMNYIFEN